MSPTFDERPGGVRTLQVLAALVIVVAGVKAAATLVVPFLMAAFVALLCLPVIHQLQRFHVPLWLQLPVLLLGIGALGLAVAALVGSSYEAFSDALPEYREQLQALGETWTRRLEAHGLDLPDSETSPLNPGSWLNVAGGVLTSATSLLTDVFVIGLLTAFLLAEGATIPGKVRASTHHPDETLKRLEEVVGRINRYFAIKTGISALTGVTAAIVLKALGVDFPFLWGVVAFALNFIPNIGSVLAALPPVLVSLVQPDRGPTTALLVIVAYLAINTVYGNVLEPRWLGAGLGLSTFVVLASLLFWGWVLGPVGMLLSTPLTAALRIAFEPFEDTRALAIWLGPPVPDPVVGPVSDPFPPGAGGPGTE